MAVVLAPDRRRIAERIDARFDEMMANGALCEVRRAARREFDPALPGMRAVGAQELRRHLDGECDLATAAAAAKSATRAYARRQMSWLRGRMGGWRWFEDGDSDAAADALADELARRWAEADAGPGGTRRAFTPSG